MSHFVYIIYSKTNDIYYKGYSTRPNERLNEHNLGKSRYTAGKGPWELVFLQEFTSKKEALVREKSLKRSNREYIQWLIGQSINVLRK